jgi:hypothetical protein
VHKEDFQKVVNEAVRMAEKASEDPIMRAEVAKAIIGVAFQAHAQALRYELLHGKD